MKRHDDLGIRHDISNNGEGLDAEQQNMMNVDDVRLQIAQKPGQLVQKSKGVGLAQRNGREMSPCYDKVRLVFLLHRERGSRMRAAMLFQGGCQEYRRNTGALFEFCRQFLCKDLRASSVKGRMVVGQM